LFPVKGSRRQPARRPGRAQLGGAPGQLVGLPVVGAVGPVLEDHGGAEQVVGVGHGAPREQPLHPAAPALVPPVQVVGELAAPVGLVLLEQGKELLVHRRLPCRSCRQPTRS
jgi:hypothetical protein